MRTITTLAAAAIVALAATGAAAQTPHDETAHPGPGRRLVCLDGIRELYLTPDEENIPGNAPIPGPCSKAPAPTTGPETVVLCIQGVTTTGAKGSTNPTGYPYHEGPCEPTAVKARPRFTG